jgi:hypothetical protein
MTEKKAGADLGAIVAAISLVIGMVTAWLYMAGWTYAYWYFDNFQLGLLALDIKREAFLIYGFWVVIENWLWLLAAIIIGLVLSFWRPQPAAD